MLSAPAAPTLLNNYFRFFDPRTGRYTQSDPIGLDGGMNTFTYVGANPLRSVDPTGRVAFVPPVVWWGAAGAAAAWAAWTSASGPGKDWTESRSRGKSDPARPADVNPGRDCDGRCNPCPPDPIGWAHEGDAHGSTGGRHYHRWQYNQDPVTCICRAGRRSSDMPL